jgi:hypothetical protein
VEESGATPTRPPPFSSQLERGRSPGQRGAALVVGAHDWQRDQLLIDLETACGDGGDGRARAAAVTADTPAPARGALYKAAGVAFVTTRILVVDLLSGVLTGDDVGGLLVLNAHRARRDGGEAFAARLARAANPACWIRALSDHPPAFMAGFAGAEAALRALCVRRLRLWPRFEARVKDALAPAGATADVVELAVRMTPDMAAAYGATAELMEACLRELRRCPRVDASGLSLDAGVHPSFDVGVLRQLDAVWHSVPVRVKQAREEKRRGGCRRARGRLATAHLPLSPFFRPPATCAPCANWATTCSPWTPSPSCAASKLFARPTRRAVAGSSPTRRTPCLRLPSGGCTC